VSSDKQSWNRERSVTLPVTLITPPSKWVTFNFRELGEYLDLLYLLVWRDIKVRYKQTLVGVSWAIIQPLINMVVFSIFFGHLAKIPSEGINYSVFTYTALVPWVYFANGLGQISNSVVNNYDLVTKVYFPRLLLPLAVALTGLVDLAIAFVILLGLMFFYGVVPTAALWTLPFFILLNVSTTLGIGLWLAAINVQYRDVSFIIPFFIQVCFFITPVVYSSSLVPQQWRAIYGLNPMAGVVEGFRWALLGKAQAPGGLIIVSVLISLGLIVSGLYYFRLKEDTFADVG